MATATKDHKACAHSAQEVIERLNLVSNVEKGWFIEIYRDGTTNENKRSVSTAIYYLLEGSVGPSSSHRVDATEVWHYYAGAPLKIELGHEDSTTEEKILLTETLKATICSARIMESYFCSQANRLSSPKATF